MRICLLGDFSGNHDEGMKNVSNTISKRLSFKHNILAISPREIFKKITIKNIRSFQPEIIHYLHGPTIRSLIILKIAKCFSVSRPKTIVSATRPYFSKFSRWAVPLFKPDLVLTQSNRFEEFFKEKGCQVKFLPNGVDCDKFTPVSENEKLTLRKQFDLSENDKIVLHVGHIKANRNLDVFKKIQKIENVRVVIVGSVSESVDEKLTKNLQKSGIKIIQKFYDDVSKFYKMVDLYVFPVQDSSNKLPDSYNHVGAIDMPLSVLEAMACNLPVITTNFGALSRIFEAGNGLSFCHTDGAIMNTVKKALNGVSVDTRQKVLPYHWGRVIEQLERIYQDTITSE
jgi:glycosyltransferase involved in cell wall biosynthesis